MPIRTPSDADRRRPLIVVFATVVAMLLLPGTPAEAAASPGFRSTYDFDYRLYGSSHFRVRSSASVKVTLSPSSGPARSVAIQIQRQVCGVFGCHWHANEGFVGGTCQRTLKTGSVSTCNFTPSKNEQLHRVVMTKANDYSKLTGRVTVA
jgi:hypothetical protein